MFRTAALRTPVVASSRRSRKAFPLTVRPLPFAFLDTKVATPVQVTDELGKGDLSVRGVGIQIIRSQLASARVPALR